MLDTLPTLSASGTATGAFQLADGRSMNFTLTVRLETPGECCVAISSAVAFAHEPPLPDDIAVRLDDRLYDGLYDGLAAIEGPLPPEHLKVAVESLTSEPPLAMVLEPVNWQVITSIGDRLAALAAEAVVAAWPELARRTGVGSAATPALP